MELERRNHWIEVDAYDRKAFAAFVADSPSLLALIERGGKLLPHFDGFLLDLYGMLFKLNVVFHREEEVVPSAGFYRLLLEQIVGTPVVEALQRRTRLEERTAGLATLLLGEKLLELLKSERILSRGEMLDYWGLERQERDIAARDEEIETAQQLAERETGAPARRLADTAKRIRRENDAARRHLERARVRMAAPARENVTRHRARLLAETHETTNALDQAAENAAAWSLQLGGGQRRSAGAQIELGKRLAANPKLKRLASLVGRMRTEARALRRSVFERAASEVFETGLGAELAHLLPHELIALRHPLLRLDFRRRLLEQQLAAYRLRDRERQARGPMVVCLDGSSSMEGEKEIWAKAVSLTLLDIARRQRRAFRSICFAGPNHPLHVLDLYRPTRPAPDSVKILDLAEYFPGGGTDFRKPLSAALDALREKPYRRGDIVFITDGECQVDPHWQQEFLAEKKRLGFSLFAVLIDVGSSSAQSLQALSDRVTTVSRLTSESGAAIFERI